MRSPKARSTASWRRSGARRLRSISSPGPSFRPSPRRSQSVSQTYTSVWLAIMFVLMAIGIVNTQLMAVFERTREFGLVQALGMRPGTVIAQVLIESALLVGLGVLAGIALAAISLAAVPEWPRRSDFLRPASTATGLASVIYPQARSGRRDLASGSRSGCSASRDALAGAKRRRARARRRDGRNFRSRDVSAIIRCRGVEQDLPSGLGRRAGAARHRPRHRSGRFRDAVRAVRAPARPRSSA